MKIRKNYCVSYPYLTHRSVLTCWGVQKNGRNEIKSCGGPSRLAVHLRDHFIITGWLPFGIAAVDSGFIFQDDNA